MNLVNSTTSYEYDLRTRTYIQPTFSYQTLQRLQTVNRDTLLGLTTTKRLVFEKREVPNGTSLFDLVGVALKDPSLAPVVLDALMVELSAQTKYRSSLLPEHLNIDNRPLDIPSCWQSTTSKHSSVVQHTAIHISLPFDPTTSPSHD